MFYFDSKILISRAELYSKINIVAKTFYVSPKYAIIKLFGRKEIKPRKQKLLIFFACFAL